MRLHRFYIKNIEKQGVLWNIGEERILHQLKNVFRIKIGQKILVFNENIGEVELGLEEINKKDMSFAFLRHVREYKDSVLSKRQVNLYMSIIKNSNFDLIVEKAVELGVVNITPVITERTIKNNLNMDRLKKIIIEATEQSGRLDLLKIHNAVKLGDVQFTNNYKVYGSIENESNLISNRADTIDVFIGPEGGFTESEIDFLKRNNVEGFCINKNVLRAETAAIAFMSVLSI